MRQFKVIVNGNEYDVQVEEVGGVQTPEPIARAKAAREAVQKETVQKEVSTPKVAVSEEKPEAKVSKKSSSKSEGSVVVEAPLPGSIFNILVKVGDKVSAGTPLLILEAMKMENEIMAPKDGTVLEIKVQQGVSVNAGEALVVID